MGEPRTPTNGHRSIGIGVWVGFIEQNSKQTFKASGRPSWTGNSLGSPQALAEILASIRESARTRLGRNTFDNRLVIQKAVYLLKALGDRRANGFRYNYYFRGPYSPDLTVAYYALAESEFVFASGKRTSVDTRTRAVGAAIDRGVDFIEAAATLHWVIVNNSGISEARAFEIARQLKPRLAGRLPEARSYLKEIGLAA